MNLQLVLILWLWKNLKNDERVCKSWEYRFVTSHNIELVSKICDRVAIINNGKVVELFDLNKNPNKRLQLAKIFIETYGGRE